MRVVIQRVKEASVTVDAQRIGCIGRGLLVFLAIAKTDTEAQADQLLKKVLDLRIFDDDQGKMNLCATQVSADILVVSQFTLLGDCSKGRRPSFDAAADPGLAERLYDYFVMQLKKTNATIATGRFRAMMDVALVNDGPVTFILESQ
jgi:D-aminoacyl-tRNA deacylase